MSILELYISTTENQLHKDIDNLNLWFYSDFTSDKENNKYYEGSNYGDVIELLPGGGAKRKQIVLNDIKRQTEFEKSTKGQNWLELQTGLQLNNPAIGLTGITDGFSKLILTPNRILNPLSFLTQTALNLTDGHIERTIPTEISISVPIFGNISLGTVGMYSEIVKGLDKIIPGGYGNRLILMYLKEQGGITLDVLKDGLKKTINKIGYAVNKTGELTKIHESLKTDLISNILTSASNDNSAYKLSKIIITDNAYNSIGLFEENTYNYSDIESNQQEIFDKKETTNDFRKHNTYYKGRNPLLNKINYEEKSLRTYYYFPDEDRKLNSKIQEDKDPLSDPIYMSSIETTNDLVDFWFKPFRKDSDIIQFRNTIPSFSDKFDVLWNEIEYIGRPDVVYTYKGYKRKTGFNFIVAASSPLEMKGIYYKLTKLAQYATPVITLGKMVGQIMELHIGDYYNNIPIILNSLEFENDQDYPWEIGDGVSDILYQIPMIIKVNVDLTILGHETLTSTSNRFFDVINKNKKMIWE
ncbi:MAG: hypothetical protein M0R17_09250 [Candidatus Omnitrophica bacterium]|jgi:hypothetical protein|nr:hypothetical protein [Candidatus Omnitrophota bacterium]